jgi:hypothetical protein
MKEVKFSGIRPKGTMNPRRLWTPGESLRLDEEVAEALLKEPGFTLVRRESKKAEA